MPFGTQFSEILYLQKILNIMSGVIYMRHVFDSQDILSYQNAIQGQFLSQKKLFLPDFGHL